MDTPREIGLSLLHDLLWPEAMDRGEWAAGRLARERGRVDGTVAALVSVGVISAEEAEEWRAELLAGGGVPFVDAAYRDDASRILGAFLDAAQKTGDRGARLRYDGALGALAEIGAIDRDAWRDAFGAEFVVMRSEGEALEGEHAAFTELYPLIGTDQELVGVIAGPAELLEGWRVLYGLRFADDVVFGCWSEAVAERRGDEEDESGEDVWHFDLEDDVGTFYGGGDAWGRDGFQGVSFPTVGAQRTPTELVLISRAGRRLRLPL